MLWPLYEVKIKKKKDYDQIKINQMFVGNAREILGRLITSFLLKDVGYPIEFNVYVDEVRIFLTVSLPWNCCS